MMARIQKQAKHQQRKNQREGKQSQHHQALSIRDWKQAKHQQRKKKSKKWKAVAAQPSDGHDSKATEVAKKKDIATATLSNKENNNKEEQSGVSEAVKKKK